MREQVERKRFSQNTDHWKRRKRNPRFFLSLSGHQVRVSRERALEGTRVEDLTLSFASGRVRHRRAKRKSQSFIIG